MSQTLLAAETVTTSTLTAPQAAMTLAALTYAPSPDQIAPLLSGGTLALGTDWSVVWGPGLSEFSSNLMYVAYNAGLDTYAVVVRGTVLTYSLATLVDLYEDLDVCTTVNWEYPPTQGAVIANGTAFGLTDLLGIRSGGQTLTDYLTDNVVSGGAALWVAGHSLGGCLATVLAAYLQNWAGSGVGVTPYTFAGPTAGNQGFADLYTGLFGDDNRYFNTIDLVPMAWQDLDGMKGLFDGGPSCPFEMAVLVDVVQGWLSHHGVSYAQPGAGSALPGTVMSPGGWFTEVGDQHNHNTYLTLLGAPTLPF
jgi:hypothetical protein